jgi:hypothetical protein
LGKKAEPYLDSREPLAHDLTILISKRVL